MYECESLEELRNFTGNSFKGCVAEEDWETVLATIKRQLALSNDFDYLQFHIKTAKGTVRFLENYGRLIQSADEGDSFYVFALDVMQKERVNLGSVTREKPRSADEEKVISKLISNRRKNVLDSLFEGFSIVGDGTYIILYDVKLDITRWSPTAVDVFNLPGEYVEISCYDFSKLIHEEDRERYIECMSALLEGSLPFYEVQYRMRTKDGTYTLTTNKGFVIPDEEGNPDFIGGVIRDHDILSHMDPVTGLRNQYGFFQDLSAMMSEDEECIILLIGLDNFTNINDMRGYNHGNHVLQEFGRMLKTFFSENNGVVYRMDGPKYTIIVKDSDEEWTAELYRQIQLRLRSGFYVEAVRHNLIINGGQIKLNHFQVSEKTVYSCLNYAYKDSKENRHGDISTFRLSMNEDNRRALEKINVIRDSVIDGCKGFYLCYQPIVDTNTERLTAMEALLRWRGEPYGEVPPYQFVPILEEDAIFPELGEWILRQAMKDGVRFLKKYPDVLMHVNLSYVQLEKEDFSDMLLRIIDDLKFPPKNLCLEITEGCRLLDMNKLINVVTSLKERGIAFAIDDFGTGFASIDILKRLPANVVKIDREFIKDIDKSEQDRQALQRISELAAIYGSNVCAEGIETIEMRDIVRQYPIDSIQGFLYSRPIPFDEFMSRNFK